MSGHILELSSNVERKRVVYRNRYVKRNNISYNMSLPVWRAIFLPCPKKPYSAGFAAMQ